MCGRFTITKTKEEIEEAYHADYKGKHTARYNAAPSQLLPVILNENPKQITKVYWGLRPKWIESVKKSGDIINVRMENLRDKKTFKSDLENRRCLVISDGFFEWKKQGGGKQPYWITLKKNHIFSFAGIWEENILKDGKKHKTFAIITTEPNGLLKKIHNRMPVILSKREEKQWLQETSKDKLVKLLDSFPEKQMKAIEMSKAVNSPANDSPKTIERASML